MPATVIPGYTFLSGDVLTAARLNAAASGTVPNATDTALGVIQLTGDLAGLATSPSISLALISAYGRTLTASIDAPAARAILGLGSISTSSTINGSMWSGQDLAVVDGGTGASDAVGARTNLGAQAQSAFLDQIAAVAPVTGTMLFHNGAAYVGTPSGNFGRSLLNSADQAAAQIQLGITPGSSVQPYSIYLAQIAAIVPLNGTMLFHDGTNYAATPSQAFGRTLVNAANSAALTGLLGLGSISTVNSPVPIANGGTAALNAADARTNLGLGSMALLNAPLSVANGGTGRTDTKNTAFAWVQFDFAFNILASYNVSSVVFGGGSTAVITLATAMPSTQAVVVTSSEDKQIILGPQVMSTSVVHVHGWSAFSGADQINGGHVVVYV